MSYNRNFIEARVQMEEILGNLANTRIISFVKIILTKIGLKPIILLIIHSNLCRNYLFPILINIIKLPLRLKYYKLIRINQLVPLKHLIAIDIIQKLSKIYEPYGVKFFLTGGQLLGAVRQGAFAGRPQDVDLGLIDTHFDKFYKNIHLIKKNFNTLPIKIGFDKKEFKISNPDFAIIQSNVKQWTQMEDYTFCRFETDRFQFVLDKMLVDIEFFSLKKINDKKYWVGNSPKLSNIFFSYNDLLELDTIRAYDLKFYSPQNPEKYLEAVFGKNWKTSKQKQFIWEK